MRGVAAPSWSAEARISKRSRAPGLGVGWLARFRLPGAAGGDRGLSQPGPPRREFSGIRAGPPLCLRLRHRAVGIRHRNSIAGPPRCLCRRLPPLRASRRRAGRISHGCPANARGGVSRCSGCGISDGPQNEPHACPDGGAGRCDLVRVRLLCRSAAHRGRRDHRSSLCIIPGFNSHGRLHL